MTQLADLVLTNARIQLSSTDALEGWLSVHDGRVLAVGQGEPPDGTSVLDCGGKHVLPGAVDIHTHFRDPGDPDEETFPAGTLAAAFGGVTTVVDMPNTGNQVRTPADYVEKRDYLVDRSYVDYGLHVLLVDSAEYMQDFRDLGVAGLKWLIGYAQLKGVPCQPSSNAALRDALVAAAANDIMVGVHAESLPWMRDLTADLKANGRDDVKAHLDSRPPFVEAIAVAEVCVLAAEFGPRFHIHHLTAELPLKTAVALRSSLGIPLTIETCPSYLFLTHDDVEEQGAMIQVNPPMREAADQRAMWEGILSGAIDSVGSDHAPRRHSEKQGRAIWDVPPGVVAVETMLPLFLDQVADGRLSLGRLVALLSERPAELVRIDDRKGSLTPGHDADIVIVDFDSMSTIASTRLHSTLTFTPYEGRNVQGAITDVLVRGRSVVASGELVAGAPFGRHVPSSYAVVAETAGLAERAVEAVA